MELRLAYFLPEPLKQYVGPVGIYADVDEILQQNMQTMKARPLQLGIPHCQQANPTMGVQAQEQAYSGHQQQVRYA